MCLPFSFSLMGAQAAPLSVSTANGTGAHSTRNFSDSADKIQWVFDADTPVNFRATPENFAIRAGDLLMISTSQFPARFVKATSDGALELLFPAARNCTVVIERGGAGNLLSKGDFEGGDTLVSCGWTPDVQARTLPSMGWGHEGMPPEGLESKNSVGGQAQISTSLRRNGNGALELVKTRGSNVVAARSGAVALQSGKTYELTAYCRMKNPGFGSNLAIIVEVASPEKATQYHREGYNSSPLIYAEGDTWQANRVRFSVPGDFQKASATIYLAAVGAPFTAYFDDLELREVPSNVPQFNFPLSKEQIAPRYGSEELLRLLAKRAPVSAQVERNRVLVNGKPLPLFGFTSQPDPDAWPLWSSHNDFFDAGIKLQWVPAYSARREGKQFSQFGPMPWIGDKKYDFSAIDKQLEAVLRRDPSAILGLYAAIYPPPNWGDKHPDAVWVNARGEKIVGEKDAAKGAITRPEGQSWAISYTAQEYQDGVADYLRALGAHLSKSPYGKAVAAIHLVGGTDGQWFHHDWTSGAGDLDYSPGGVRAYRNWLQTRYKNDVAALRRSWNDPKVTFQTATLPLEIERNPAGYFLEPNRDGRLIDANFWSAWGVSALINRCARAWKTGLARPTLVTTYYHNKHHGWKPLLDSPDVDGFVGVPEYGAWRQLGRTGEIALYPASIRLHNKFFLSEFDNRTELSDTWGSNALPYEWVSVVGSQNAAHQMRRDMGAALAEGGGAWLYALPGNSWATPDHMEYVREMNKAAGIAATAPPVDEKRQIAVFFDEDSEKYASRLGIYGPVIRNAGNRLPRVALSRSGLSWDQYLLSDLGNPNLPDYKMIVFATSGTISELQIAFVKAKWQGGGRVLLFLHNPAVSTGGVVKLGENSLALTGMKLGVDTQNTQTPRYVRVGNDPLGAGLEDTLSEHAGPLFYVEDASATPLAVFSTSPRVAAAVKRHNGPNGKWTGVFGSQMAGLTPQFLRALAQQAGLTPIGPEDDVTFSGQGFTTIHALKKGQKTLNWGGKNDVVDLTTGETLARGVASFTFPMEAQTTRWFRRVPTMALNPVR